MAKYGVRRYEMVNSKAATKSDPQFTSTDSIREQEMDAATLGKLFAALIWGLVVGLLAKRKNRNPWGWGVAGALSWIIALFILAFMPYKCPKCNQSITNDQGKNKNCPSCGSFQKNVEILG